MDRGQRGRGAEAAAKAERRSGKEKTSCGGGSANFVLACAQSVHVHTCTEQGHSHTA